MVRVLDELLWGLRRDGFEISTAQAIDALARSVRSVSTGRALVREAIAAWSSGEPPTIPLRRGLRRVLRAQPGAGPAHEGHAPAASGGAGFAAAELDALPGLLEQIARAVAAGCSRLASSSPAAPTSTRLAVQASPGPSTLTAACCSAI